MIPEVIIDKMMVDRKVRKEIVRNSHIMFFNFYFAHYVKYETAPFQKEMFHLTENELNQNLYFVSFRGSGKSTIITTSYPLWSILGMQQKKFIVLIFQTTAQAKQHMANLRHELEQNQLLKNDLGPFKEESDQWGSESIVFSESKARIKVMSTEQSIRGVRHQEHRPDLIIADDIQDLASCKTQDSRDKIYQWYKGEVIPAGDMKTRIIIVGNLLHNDSLLMRIKTEINEYKHEGVFKEYPFLNQDGECLWKGKFTTDESIQKLKQNTASEVSWQREYLLKIIPEDDQVINPEWIRYYNELPEMTNATVYRYTARGIDLAISEQEKADKTAIVSASVHGFGENLKIYIHVNPINERLNFPATIDKITKMPKHKVFVEAVGIQSALTQMLVKEGVQAIDVKINVDKRTRLCLASPAIQSGKVLFASRGNEALINQIINFGSERYDDLVDAFTLLINKIMSDNNHKPSSFSVPANDPNHRPITAGLMDMKF